MDFLQEHETEIKIDGTSFVNIDAIEHLKTTTNVKKIKISYSNPHTSDVISALVSNEYLKDTLQELEFSHKKSAIDFTYLFEYIRECKFIKYLDFSYTRLLSDDLIKLADIVKKCTTLETLKIVHSYEIKELESLIYLIDSIKDSNVQKFNMYHFFLPDDELSDKLYDKIIQMISYKSKLVSLTIPCGYNPFNIIDAIENNKTIKKLSMTGYFYHDFIKLFSEMLAVNNRLTDLKINEVLLNSDDSDEDKSIQYILTALNTNSSLISLSIGYDLINKNDIIAIADMITNNTTLQKLDMFEMSDDSHVYEPFFDVLEKAITDNYTLQHVNFLNKSNHAIKCFKRNKTLSDEKRFITTKCVVSSSSEPTDII